MLVSLIFNRYLGLVSLTLWYSLLRFVNSTSWISKDDSKMHWLLKFVIGMAVGILLGYFSPIDMNLGYILGIFLGTAFAKGT